MAKKPTVDEAMQIVNWRGRHNMRDREIDLEAAGRVLAAKVERLRAVVDQVISRAEVLENIGPDARCVDGDFIHAGWLEDLADEARAALAGEEENDAEV